MDGGAREAVGRIGKNFKFRGKSFWARGEAIVRSLEKVRKIVEIFNQSVSNCETIENDVGVLWEATTVIENAQVYILVMFQRNDNGNDDLKIALEYVCFYRCLLTVEMHYRKIISTNENITNEKIKLCETVLMNINELKQEPIKSILEKFFNFFKQYLSAKYYLHYNRITISLKFLETIDIYVVEKVLVDEIELLKLNCIENELGFVFDYYLDCVRKVIIEIKYELLYVRVLNYFKNVIIFG
jgi:hypothetical protein